MALTPAERRARRDANAQGRINPDTGRPFRNYNELDTWQRNQRAKAQGFTSRAAKRHATVAKPLIAEAQRQPQAWQNFLDGRQATETLARQFKRAFGTQGPASPADRKARAQYLSSSFSGGWDWRVWRTEYSAL